VVSVPNRPGGLPRASDRTGRLSAVRPGRPRCRTAGSKGEDILVQGRGWTVGDCRERQGTIEEGRERVRTAKDGGGLRGRQRTEENRQQT